MTAIRRTATALRAVLAALVLLALVAGVPLLLVATIGNPVPDNWSWNSPLTNDAILGALACVAWIVWAQLVICVIVEFIAEVRIATGRSADWLNRIPGTFSGQQLLARTLVQAVVAVGLTSTAAAAAVPGWPAHASATAAAPSREPSPAAPTTPPPAAPEVQGAHAPREATTTTVAVAKGDTLWSIAETHLGSGERWREIAELNAGRTMTAGVRFHDSGTILPGWELLLPAPAPAKGHLVTVERGDSLWEIAEEEYGDGTEWPRIYEVNDDRIDDVDRIYPGQKLHIPGTAPKPAERPAKPARQHDQPDTGPETGQQPTQQPMPSPTVAPTAPPAAAEEPPQADAEPVDTDTGSTPLLDGATITRALLGGGGFLAAGMLAVYAGRRLTQSRNRRSGRVVRHVAAHLVEEDKALRSVGSSARESAAFFDAALRELAQLAEVRGFALPDAAAAKINADRLELHLARPAPDAPDPWLASADGSMWSVPLRHEPERTDRPSPYPTMVTLGVDEYGATWFMDLEAAGVVQVMGDQDAAADVARFIAAELALNPWVVADMVRVTGIAEELAPLNHGRLYVDSEPRLDELAKMARQAVEIVETSGQDVLSSRVLGGGADDWAPDVAIVAVDPGEHEKARTHAKELLDQRERSTGRTATALLCLVAEPLDDRGVTLTVKEDGSLVTPWAVLQANRITAAEACVLAELFDDAETEGDQAIPAASGTDGEPTGTDMAGALTEGLTDQRTGTGDPRSVLPRPDQDYVEAAATTAEDLQVLAPNVPSSEAVQAITDDPTLDADLAEWSDPATSRPKLRVLGPIELHAVGEKSKEVEARPAYFAELAAYLACHPEGVTPSRAAADFGLQHNSLHTRLGSLRKWLGKQAESEEWCLPEARRVRGQAVYRLDGVLFDADLFRRLRARGEARGPEGIEDLRKALELVSGRPFDHQRTSGYGWLVDTPFDHYLTAGIVDVAHVVATHALAVGRPRIALWAAERAIAAAPSEDKPRLDLARAMEAMGEEAEAERYLRSEVFNRSDDDRAPLDPSHRTLQVVERFGRPSPT